jgi:hypothetical protein
MKKKVLFSILICSILALSACSGQESSTSATEAAGVSQSANGTASEDQTVLQLALGTLKLESTATPVDAEEAASLLPLWKAARSLGNSETAAAEEKSGLVSQIQETMSAEQLQAIQAMGLTAQDLPAIAQELGISLGFSPQPLAAGASAGSSSQSAPQPPGGDMGSMGGMPMDGGGGSPAGVAPSSSGATKVSGSFQGSFLGLDSALLEAVIAYLETKVQ